MKIKKANIYSEQIFEKMLTKEQTFVIIQKKRTNIRFCECVLDIGGYFI